MTVVFLQGRMAAGEKGHIAMVERGFTFPDHAAAKRSP
jgi:hypothetical protein